MHKDSAYLDDYPLTEPLISMAKQWIQGAIKKPGSLRKTLGVKKGATIPVTKLRKAAKGNTKTARRARLALTLKGLKK